MRNKNIMPFYIHRILSDLVIIETILEKSTACIDIEQKVKIAMCKRLIEEVNSIE